MSICPCGFGTEEKFGPIGGGGPSSPLRTMLAPKYHHGQRGQPRQDTTRLRMAPKSEPAGSKADPVQVGKAQTVHDWIGWPASEIALAALHHRRLLLMRTFVSAQERYQFFGSKLTTNTFS